MISDSGEPGGSFLCLLFLIADTASEITPMSLRVGVCGIGFFFVKWL